MFSGTLLLSWLWYSGCWQFGLWFLCLFWIQLVHLEVLGSCTVEAYLGEFWALLCLSVRWMQLYGSLNTDLYYLKSFADIIRKLWFNLVVQFVLLLASEIYHGFQILFLIISSFLKYSLKSVVHLSFKLFMAFYLYEYLKKY